MTPYGDIDLVNIGTGNGLKLPGPMTYDRRFPLISLESNFTKLPMKWIQNMSSEIARLKYHHIPQGQMS